MNFDQGELDLSGDGSDEGHRKWLRDLEERKRVFELRYGVIIGRRVRVQLAGELNPIVGMIHVVSQKPALPAAKLRLVMGRREFGPAEIESIVRLDDEAGNDPR